MAIQITIRGDGGHFNVEIPGQVADGLDWSEMLGLVASLTHPDIKAGLYGILKAAAGGEAPADRLVPRRDGAVQASPRVNVSMSLVEAGRLSEGMADLLCWVGGFRAARPDDFSSHPMGVEETRDVRIALRRAIAEAKGEFPPEEGMPF